MEKQQSGGEGENMCDDGVIQVQAATRGGAEREGQTRFPRLGVTSNSSRTPYTQSKIESLMWKKFQLKV